MSTIVLQPTSTGTQTIYGTISGVWSADGTSTPIGSRVTIKPRAVTGPPGDFTWSLRNDTTSTDYIPLGTSQISYADWQSIPAIPDSSGFKTFSIVELNPGWSAPAALDSIRFTLDAEPGDWIVKTGVVESSEYVLVPEPSGLLAVALFVGLWMRRKAA